MKKSAQNIYAESKKVHENIYRLMAQLRVEIDKCNNMVELCDYAYAINGTHGFIEDLKKELWKFRELLNKKVCDLWISFAQRDISSVDRSIRTDYVTATPDIGQAPNIPKPRDNPEAYKKLMDYLGIDISGWPVTETENDEGGEGGKLNEVVKIHWPGLCALVTAKLAAGLPAPPGIDISKMSPVYKLTLRKRRDVLDPIDEVSNEDWNQNQNQLVKEPENPF